MLPCADVVLMPGATLPLLVQASRARWVVEHALAAPSPHTCLIAVVHVDVACSALLPHLPQLQLKADACMPACQGVTSVTWPQHSFWDQRTYDGLQPTAQSMRGTLGPLSDLVIDADWECRRYSARWQRRIRVRWGQSAALRCCASCCGRRMVAAHGLCG